jgi:hypothetical protein
VFRFVVNRMGISGNVRFFRLEFGFHLRNFWGVKNTIGLRNNTSDGKRLIFLDYDNTLYHEMLVPEARYLQEKYHLSDFYILKSSQKANSYHAICLDKLDARTWMKVLSEASCDPNYKTAPLLFDCKAWVLRVSPKGSSDAPKLITILKSPYQDRPKSNAHAVFLKFHYGVKIDDLSGLDSGENLCFLEYGTINYLKNPR